MDHPDNLTSRVWFHPFHQVLELRYECYYRRTFHLCYHSTFVVIADFDAFYSHCPGATRLRRDIVVPSLCASLL